jgi:hypothetical protein
VRVRVRVILRARACTCARARAYLHVRACVHACIWGACMCVHVRACMCMCMCLRACACVHVRAFVRVRACACMRACACACACVRAGARVRMRARACVRARAGACVHVRVRVRVRACGPGQCRGSEWRRGRTPTMEMAGAPRRGAAHARAPRPRGGSAWSRCGARRRSRRGPPRRRRPGRRSPISQSTAWPGARARRYCRNGVSSAKWTEERSAEISSLEQTRTARCSCRKGSMPGNVRKTRHHAQLRGGCWSLHVFQQSVGQCIAESQGASTQTTSCPLSRSRLRRQRVTSLFKGKSLMLRAHTKFDKY